MAANGVTVNEPGTYLITTRVQVREGSQGDTFALAVNDRLDTPGNGYNTFSTDASGYQYGTMTTQFRLNRGDRVSLDLISQGPATFVPGIGDGATNTPSISMSLVRLAG